MIQKAYIPPNNFVPKEKFAPTHSEHAGKYTEQSGLIANGPKTPKSIFYLQDRWQCI